MRRSYRLLCLAFLECVVMSALLTAPALADQVPAEFHGAWSRRCDDPAAPRIELERDRVTIVTSGQRHAYAGIVASHTWVGGAKADGKRVWLPISKQPDGPFAFVLAPPPYGRKGVMTLDEGHPDHGREVRSLVGSKFSRCPAGGVAPSETKAAPPPQGAVNWIAKASAQPVGVNLNGTATDRKVTLSGGCRKSGGLRFQGSLYGYPGNVLKRVDDQDEPVAFAVAGQDGIASFPARLVYYAPEKAWVLTDALPVAFLQAFGRGETLTIRNGKGADVVTFDLSGAAAATQTMRQGCTA